MVDGFWNGAILLTLIVCSLTAVFVIGIFIGSQRQARTTAIAKHTNQVNAQATILKTWDTGITLNHDPQVGILLQVRPYQGKPFQIETKQIIPQPQLPQLKTGAILAVQFYQDDLTRISLILNS